jgi:predicted transcriptional regulator
MARIRNQQARTAILRSILSRDTASTFVEILADVGMTRGTLQYYLRDLEHGKVIVRDKDPRVTQRDIFSIAGNEEAQKIASLVESEVK